MAQIRAIQEVTKKSKNLKGTSQKDLNQATSVLAELVDSLATRTATDETRRLQADNTRLNHELQILRRETKALRTEFAERIRPAPVPNAPPPTLPMLDARAIEELKRYLTVSIGEMVNARLANLGERLPAAPILRPPLAADKRRTTTQAVSVPLWANQPESGPASVCSQTHSRLQVRSQVPPVAAETRLQAPLETSDKEGQWQTVERRQKGNKRQAAPVAAAQANPARAATDAGKKKKKKRKKNKKANAKRRSAFAAPRSSAVVVTLHPEAIEKGLTYAQVIARAKTQLKLPDLGIDGVLCRQAATGARVFTIPGPTNDAKADVLADKLQEVLSDVAKVVRPTKMVGLRVSGLDDSVEQEEVAAAVAEQGRCSPDQVKVGGIHFGPGGTGSVIVKCPVTAAKVVVEAGRLLVGWISAPVRALESRPMRCFRCMGIGHTGPRCPAGVDRSKLCFRCGKPGHMAASCSAEFHCAVCADARRSADHRMGGNDCNPPRTNPKRGLMTSDVPPVAGRSTPMVVDMYSSPNG